MRKFLSMAIIGIFLSIASYAALGPITGTTYVCVGQTTTLADTTAGGYWTSSNTSIATIGTSGVVTGISAGVVTISYYHSGMGSVTTSFTVNPLPSAIAGPTTVTIGGYITLTDPSTGGTWSAACSVLTIGSTSGTVTGIATGTCVVTYTLPTGCFSTLVVTVSGVSVAPISGATSVCIGTTTALTDATTGGTWSSSNTSVATIGSSSGVVTGVAAGTCTITYLVGTSIVTSSMTANSAATISGASSLCAGSSITLTGSPSGGAWSSSTTTVATVTSGVVTGVAAGTANIYYAAGGCYAYHPVTVNAVPASITGTTSTTVGGTSTLSNATGGGSWSSSNSSIATVSSSSGVVTGVTAGTCTIYYCIGSCCVYTSFSVSGGTSVAAISGQASVCIGSTITLTDATTSGSWSSSNTSIATINATSGVVTGVTAGTVTITYTVGSSYVTRALSVSAGPAAIAGPTTTTVGGTVTLTDATGGGIWSSSTPSIATINSTSGLVTGVSAGTCAMTYMLTSGCFVRIYFTVTSGTSIAAISGPTGICVGSTGTMTDATTGGSWSSSNTSIATINETSGVVLGVSAGTVTITYTVGSSYVTRSLAITAGPSAISGPSSTTVGGTVTETDATTGGIWLSSSTSIATIGSSTGVVTGVSAGICTITYYLSGCMATKTFTVTGTSSISAISGPTAVCVGSTITLTDATTGGSWSSSNTSVATINATSGVVTGVSSGTVTITYTVGSLYATYSVTVTSGATISGASSVCTGSSVTLTASVSGGTWISSNTAIATVSTGGVVTGVTAGVVNIYYSISGCYAYHTVTVNAAATISGGSTLCIGATTTLTASPTGGTWSSGNTSIATITTAGVVTAVGSGVVNIYYTSGGCYSYHTMTVNATSAITGSHTLCVGTTTTLTASPSGGVWSSSNTSVATVGSTGVVSGVSGGTANIYYLYGGCYNYFTVTVNSTASVSGSSTVCAGGTTTLTGSPTGGTWSSSNTSVATVSTAGVVTGIASGTVNIYYSAGGCYAYHPMTVNATASITGSSIVCTVSTTTLTGSPTGGTWTSSATGIATISTGGVVTGVSAGTATIYYSSGGCYAYRLETVNPAPAAITGPGTVCVGSAITLADATSGGTWSSGNTSIATVTSTGVVTGVSTGVVNIYYSIGTSCGVYHTVTVTPVPASITGGTSVLIGYDLALADATSGGTWISSNTSIATVNATSGVVLGVSSGTVTIYYLVGGCATFVTITVSEVPLDPIHSAGISNVGANGTAAIVSVYPNPTGGSLNVKWDNQVNGNAIVRVTDVTGREVFISVLEINTVSGQAQFDLSNLKDGIYLLTIKSDHIFYTGKLQIQK